MTSELDLNSFEVLTFDCYGTLIDWESGILNALRPVLASNDVHASREQLLTLYSELESPIQQEKFRSYRDVLALVVMGIGERLGFEPSTTEQRSLAESLPSWPPFPDTMGALSRLAARYRLGIVSNVVDDLFSGTAETLGVEFDFVVTAEQVGSLQAQP